MIISNLSLPARLRNIFFENVSCHIWNNGQLRKCLYKLHNFPLPNLCGLLSICLLSKWRLSYYKTKLYKEMNKENHNLNWPLFQRRIVLREDIFQWSVINSAQLIFIRFAEVSFLFLNNHFASLVFWRRTFLRIRLWPPNK